MMPTLMKGDKGDNVKVLQYLVGTDADGIFGPKTKKAVEIFQTKYGIDASGVVSTQTWEALAKAAPTIKRGSRGDAVRAWQVIVGETNDGIFGSKTKAATIAFQASLNLNTTGTVDANTWLAAFTKNPKTVVNKKPVDYKQYDSRWKNVVYTKNNTYNKKQTIRNSGCGPTAMADIVATWWDANVTPVEMAKISVAEGYRTENSGTASGFFKFIAEKYGASKFIKTTSYTTAVNALKEGALIVANMGAGLFTTGGHYICWWKTDGTYNYTNDPASAKSKRAKQEIKYIKNEAKRFFIFYK